MAFINDVVRAWTLAIQSPVEKVVGQKFFVGSLVRNTPSTTWQGSAETASGADVPIEYVGYRPGEEGHREAFSVERARSVLGYVPRSLIQRRRSR